MPRPSISFIPAKPKRLRLTDRQIEILDMFAEGMSVPEIAEVYGIVPNQIYVELRDVKTQARIYGVGFDDLYVWMDANGWEVKRERLLARAFARGI